MSKPSVAVLVVSHDEYQDLWHPFFTLFSKYWPDCPYPIYLLANQGAYEAPNVTMITVGDADWSSRLMGGLRQLPQTRVLMMLEDFLLMQPVDTVRIQAVASYMEQRQAGCLRLFPAPAPNGGLCEDNLQIGTIRKGTRYRACTQAALWDKEVLSSLLRAGESIWQFERQGTKRANHIEPPFLSVTRESSRPLPYFCTAVVKGKWMRKAVNLCRQEGITIDLNVRSQETFWDRFKDTRIYSLYRIPAEHIFALLR